jgi:integrase
VSKTGSIKKTASTWGFVLDVSRSKRTPGNRRAARVGGQSRREAVRLPRIRLHDLRHTHATHLLAAGTNVRVTSERLGHASVAFTLDVYGHVLPGQQAAAAAAVAALVDR